MLLRKSLVLGLTVSLFLGLLAGCSTSETPSEKVEGENESAYTGSYDLSDVKEREIAFSDRMGEAHIMGRTHIKFGETIKELSGGKIEYVKYLSGEIETGGNHIRDIYSTGVTDVARGQLELLGYYGYDKGSVFGLPYVIANRDHFWKFAESDLGAEVLEDVNNQDWSLHALSYIEEGARHFFTVKDLDSYKDLAGRKIRVQSSDIYVGLVEALGGSATPIAWPEVYTALSTGVVDGAENPYSGYQASLLDEVAPYILEDGHIFAGGFLAVSDHLWNDLSDTEKAIFEEAAKIASAYNKEENQTDEANIKAQLLEEGVKIIELTDEEKEEIKALVEPMYAEFAPDHLDLIEEIQNMK